MPNQNSLPNYADNNFNLFLANLVTNAMNSMNARADEILEEIEMNHWESMRLIEFMEEANDRDHCIAMSLLPHKTFDEWWDNLSDEEMSSWYEDYYQYQWGSNGGMEFEDSGEFTHAVFEFLNSRERRVPFCAFCDSRHESPGSCMESSRPAKSEKVTSKYHLTIISADLSQFDGIEVHGVVDVNAGHDHRAGTCFEVDDDNPTSYSVYVHCVLGGVECVGDFSELSDAKEYAEDLSTIYSWPWHNFCNETIH